MTSGSPRADGRTSLLLVDRLQGGTRPCPPPNDEAPRSPHRRPPRADARGPPRPARRAGRLLQLGNALGLAVGIGLQVGQGAATARARRGRRDPRLLAGDVSAVVADPRDRGLLLERQGLPPGLGARRPARRAAEPARRPALGDRRDRARRRSADPRPAAPRRLLRAAARAGKFGSALHRTPRGAPRWPAGWPDPFRSAVLVSRVPAMLAALSTSRRGCRRRVAGGAGAAANAPPLLPALGEGRPDLLFAPAAPRRPSPTGVAAMFLECRGSPTPLRSGPPLAPARPGRPWPVLRPSAAPAPATTAGSPSPRPSSAPPSPTPACGWSTAAAPTG